MTSKAMISAAPILLALVIPAFAQTTTTIDNTETQAEITTLDTPEARRAVQPLDWNVTRGEGLRSRALEEPETLDLDALSPGIEGGGDPNAQANEEAQTAFPDAWDDSALQTQDQPSILGTKDIYTQYSAAPYRTHYPRRAIGKLFTNSGSCSASVISGNNVIVTAAHCCYNRSSGSWIGGFRFAPAYDNGNTPYGMFNWSSATILNRWISVGDRKSDVCVIKLRNNAQNRPVTFYTGWLGRSWNFGTTQSLHALGYPGNIGGGNKMELCSAESFNPSSGCGGSSVLNMGCSMTFGSSGGPWLRSWRGGNWVNSVVSGYDNTSCTGSFGQTFNGPRFTSDNIVKLCNAIGC
ncbi:MAG: trypsin-like serine protease [Pseudomonadota bacterium]